jgi:hypothetical protein
MEQVKINTLNKAIQMLNAIGVQYAVIDFDGNHHGELQVEKPKKRKTTLDQKWGEISEHIKPFIEGIRPGEVRTFTCGKFPPETVRSTTSSILIRWFGKSTYTTAVKRETNELEVLRII